MYSLEMPGLPQGLQALPVFAVKIKDIGAGLQLKAGRQISFRYPAKGGGVLVVTAVQTGVGTKAQRRILTQFALLIGKLA